MTRSLYILGGAGVGKSTFTADLMEQLCMTHSPLEDLWSKKNAKANVTLRGHRMYNTHGVEGLYLGVLRESFPGTDGLDRASSLTGEEWLHQGELPEWILAEGATLATRRFLNALNETTDLLVVHLHAEDFVKELRFNQRGSNQDARFVSGTATRALNRWAESKTAGIKTLDIDTAEPERWNYGIAECALWLDPQLKRSELWFPVR